MACRLVIFFLTLNSGSTISQLWLWTLITQCSDSAIIFNLLKVTLKYCWCQVVFNMVTRFSTVVFNLNLHAALLIFGSSFLFLIIVEFKV